MNINFNHWLELILCDHTYFLSVFSFSPTGENEQQDRFTVAAGKLLPADKPELRCWHDMQTDLSRGAGR